MAVWGIGGAWRAPGLLTHPVRRVGGVGSLSEYQRSAGAVHSIGWHLVWCSKYGKRVFVGPVAGRLRGLLLAKAVERGWSVEALESMPDHVHLFVRTPPDVSVSRVAHQLTGFRGRP